MILSILYSALLLASIGIVAAVILYVVSKKFYVYEDPLIAEVDEILPAANCGGCGSPGCKAFAEKLVTSDDISELFCPVGGNDVMKEVASLLGKEVKEQDVLDTFKIVGLDNFYKSLSKGFDTHLEPTGKQLSSSSVQKLLIARSLLNQPALLLFH